MGGETVRAPVYSSKAGAVDSKGAGELEGRSGNTLPNGPIQ